jgi:membrane associated rhomboid family serine protease
MTLSLPPFTRAVKWLVIINAAIYLLEALLGAFNLVSGGTVNLFFGLVPLMVVHGWLWQLVTYMFIHAGLFHVLFNMLAVWMFGGMLESDWGSKRFLEFYFFCGVGAALITIGISFTHVLGMSPSQATVGASGAVYGILMAFGILYGEQEIFMFPLPFMIKAKYFVAILIFIAIAGAVTDVGGMANFAHLGGLLFGWLYVKHGPRRGLGVSFSERYYGLRNRYFKWKRRRAARKFEVYMRKHSDDPKRQYFDEYGNYRGHEEPKKDDHGKSGWVN